MNIDIAQGETKVKIIILTDSELIFLQEEEETIEQTQGGIIIEIKMMIESRSVWKRQ